MTADSPRVPSSEGDPLVLEMRGIGKSFPGVRALDGVDLGLGRGEVLAVLGENGAGKSTLMKILSGDYQRDEGDIFIDGAPIHFRSPHDAQLAGIAMIYQELNAVPDLSVAENIMLGALPTRRILGLPFVSRAKMHDVARDALSRLRAQIDTRRRMGDLSVAERQIVEIARALRSTARIIVMDEPTAPLGATEVERLFEVIRALTAGRVSVIYISHRIGEVFHIADRVVVLRDGRVAGDYRPSETSWESLVRAMVGRDLERVYPRKSADLGEPVMRVRSLGSEAFRDVSFDLRAGEILGVFGLLGSGCGELVRALYGALLAGTGSIEVGSTSGLFRSPAAARHAGVGLIPLDRKQDGLVLGMDVSANLTLGTAGRYTRSGFLRRRLEDARATEWVKRLTIRTPSVRQQVRLLSGGNQQKVVIARWLEAGARVLVMDEPTRGVDVGARVEIYRILEELAEKGVGIVMSSTDLSEVASLSDRILVLHRGRVVALLEREDFDQETLLSLALGGQAA